MDYFNDRDGVLHAEDVPVTELAERFGTPCYVYSRATLERHWRAFDAALGDHPHLICYAVKANSNLAVLNLLARLGSGFDVVSGGELERVLRAGGDPARTVFSGVGKQVWEMRRALEVGIRCFNIESGAELERLNDVAGATGCRAPVSLRVNPDVDAGTHPYISTGLRENKFGVDVDTAMALYRRAAELPHLDVAGIDCHIGSQLTRLAPLRDALDRLLDMIDRLAAEGIAVRHLDLGGGLGIRYRDETPPGPAAYARALRERIGDRALEIMLEPGRAIAGNAGILLTRVEYLKHTPERHFALVDAAMNDLIRPALYGGWHDIVPVVQGSPAEMRAYDVVGPVCESADFLGKERMLALTAGDLLAVRSAGAYGFVMSSNYNTRPRAAELLVDGTQVYVVRERENFEQMVAGECLLP
ncbi:diaminopimelate decarboxylase [Acidihalobacter ferrooxydans]|uniref:Diaminopimelate decarboxylase n=1 Tax=Acidihalobacter ferrooxydans TaxID=1765967 RepID=A0A1P8UDK5_9GAMM|nr:diaminopimelate decarboxylase [Acidihalobacter ferrooxydans]APZ41925.1 diaminopimelate decarboxylase [Acidihalobacter ferrooxydans]